MNRFVTSAVAVVLSVVVIGCSGSAPTSPSSVQGGVMIGGRLFQVDEGPFTSGDSNFITVSARMHQAFIQLARAAEGRVAHPGVKLFAQQMAQENAERLNMLRASVRSAVSQTIVIDPAHQDLINRVSATSGNEADRAFTQGFLPELEAMLALYQAEASGASSRVLRELANDFVDRLSNYIEQLRELTNRVR
jgi:uncharacterized protein (DUF305 family)